MAETEIQKLPVKEVQRRIRQLLTSDLDDAALRDQLEELSQARVFTGFTWLWGPELYRRNRVMFRPFILNHFSSTLLGPDWRWEHVQWNKNEVVLNEWFAAVDAADDDKLFQKLYLWKHSTGQWRGLDAGQWRTDLITRFQAATPARRTIVLSKFDIRAELDESTALALYRIDKSVGSFVLGHLGGNDKRKLWPNLMQEALDQSDEDFAFQLYRRQIDAKRWNKDVLELAETVADSTELCSELARRHPEGWGLKLGLTFFQLVQKRDRDVLPYVQKHMRTVFRSWWGGRDGYRKLVSLAAKNQWWDLWSSLVRTCAHGNEYNSEVKKLLDRPDNEKEVTKTRLLMLTGVSREWNSGPWGLAHVHQFDDKTAVRLYKRFPELMRGPFRMNISVGYELLPKLTQAALDNNDEVIIDYIASRLVTRARNQWGWGGEHVDAAEKLSKHFEAFRDDDQQFARRAVNVLSQVPAYTVFSYGQLVRTNRLARMFYQRSAASYLTHPVGVRDLLEAADIHSQALGFRVLGLDSDQARQLAVENLDLLQATLLRPLHRKTRLMAFQAIENAATDADTAARIHDRCRQAMDLPEKRYPRDQLIGLIGRLLQRWPQLRSPAEQPVIFGLATMEVS